MDCENCKLKQIYEKAIEKAINKKAPKPKKATITFNKETMEFEDILPELIKKWEDAFPAVDIGLAMKSAALWVMNNPTKTKSQWGRFLTNWFSRCQQRGGNRNKPAELSVHDQIAEYERKEQERQRKRG
ncbi:MAG: hypothetical protein KAS32_14080 [Candidatus Peribacteraceae bacterium]|nr:hypothetical protein [Candidatus Peribacteraceae bacterium]